MDERMRTMLKALRLSGLLERWDEYLTLAQKRDLSAVRWLEQIIADEYQGRRERARICRLKRARIPEAYVLATYPFARQPKLDRKRLVALHDAFTYVSERRNLIWLGPTGCGKTGLATSFLTQAIERGHAGRFIVFAELVAELYAAAADHTQARIMRKYAAWDCLLIDEVGYVEVEPAQIGLFFTLMQKRHKRKTTLLTSNLGFSEWQNFLKSEHLTAALIDRLTETSHVFNLRGCRSLRESLDPAE